MTGKHKGRPKIAYSEEVMAYLEDCAGHTLLTREEEQVIARALQDTRRDAYSQLFTSLYVIPQVIEFYKPLVGDDRISTYITVPFTENWLAFIGGINDGDKAKVNRETLPSIITGLERVYIEMLDICKCVSKSDNVELNIGLKSQLEEKTNEALAVIRQAPPKDIARFVEELRKVHAKVSDSKDGIGDDSFYQDVTYSVLLAVEPVENITSRLYNLARALGSWERNRRKLVEHNLRLAFNCATKYFRRVDSSAQIDLVQQSNYGLIKAAERFDAYKGYKFSTYATWWCKQAVTRYLSDTLSTVRVPVHIRAKLDQLHRQASFGISGSNHGANGGDSTGGAGMQDQSTSIRELIKLTGNEMLRDGYEASSAVSLDGGIDDDKGKFYDVSEDPHAREPIDGAAESDLSDVFGLALAQLTFRERLVMMYRHGLIDGYEYTLEEVGAVLKVSRERIRQIEANATTRLRRILPRYLPHYIDSLRNPNR